MIGLISHNANRLSSQMAKTDDNVLGIRLMDLEEILVIQNLSYYHSDVVGQIGVVRHNKIQVI